MEISGAVAKKWLLILALALAYAVQLACFPVNPNSPFFQKLLALAPWLGREETRLLAGAGGYLLAMALFAWAAPPLPSKPSYRTQREIPPHSDAGLSKGEISSPSSRRNDAVRTVFNVQWGIIVALLCVALGLWGLSITRFLQMGEDAMTRGLWLVSMGALLGAAGIMISAEKRSRQQGVRSKKQFLPFDRCLLTYLHNWRRGLALVAILTGAAWLRFYLLADIPQDLHGDMASMGLQARAILAGAAPGIFHQGWADIPMLGFYPSVIGLKLISNSVFGLNFMPAVEGTLTILGLYLLAWRLFDSHRLAALAAAALAVNIPHIHFSRLAAYMDPWPWMLFAILFLAHGLRTRRLWPFPLAGLALGAGLQMYYSGRVMLIILPLTILALLALFWPAARRRARFLLAGASLAVLGALIALGPSLIYFLQHTGPLLERSRSVFLFHPAVMTHLMRKYGVSAPSAVLWQQIKASLLMFNLSHDASTQFGYTGPLFGAALSPLVWLGVGYSLRRWRRPATLFALIWMGAILISGSILTNNAPFWPRLVGILPAAALMIGLSIDAILRALRLDKPVPFLLYPSASASAILALALGFLLLGQQNWGDYFAFTSNNARPTARIGRYLDALPDDIRACSLSQPYRLNDREAAFLAWPHILVDLPPAASGEMLKICPGPARVWILSPTDDSQLARVQLQWPQGQVRIHRNSAQRPIFASILIADQNSRARPHDAQATGRGRAWLPDGSLFIPQKTWLGDISSSTARWRVGPVRVRNGYLTLQIGPVAGHDAVYDYVELIDAQGVIRRFQAEDPSITSGDDFASRDAVDNHWWLQDFGPFSGGRALAARKGEMVPVLTTAIPLPNGLYDLSIGVFTGDPANGVFGLGLAGAGD